MQFMKNLDKMEFKFKAAAEEERRQAEREVAELKEKAEQDRINGLSMTELTHKIEDLKKIIGPHGTGASVKNTKYLDLLVYKYQLEENDKKQNIKKTRTFKKIL